MSRLPLFFIDPDQVSGRTIAVRDDDVRHIASVLRMKPGDRLVLCDGRGTDYTVVLTTVTKAAVLAEIESERKRPLLAPRIILGQGIAKSDKMDWIVQKATELGATAIVPLVTERTIVKVHDEEKRVSRWQKICREAAMQSDRPDIPTVAPIISFKEYLRTLDPGPGTLHLLPWEEGTQPLRNVLRGHPGVQEVVVLIGPEGGFSRTEAGQAAGRGFHAVSLGPTILRTETAAVAALGMVAYEYF